MALDLLVSATLFANAATAADEGPSQTEDEGISQPFDGLPMIVSFKDVKASSGKGSHSSGLGVNPPILPKRNHILDCAYAKLIGVSYCL